MWAVSNAIGGASLPSMPTLGLGGGAENDARGSGEKKGKSRRRKKKDDDEDEDGEHNDPKDILEEMRREEEIELDEIDGVEDTEDDDNQYSPEALRWAEDHNLDRSFARYHKLAKDRSHEDVRDLARTRRWRVRLRGIQYTNHGELGDFFLTFNFGWNFKLSKQLLRVKASAQNKKMADDHGRPIEQKRRWRWVKSGTRGTAKYTQVRKDVEKGKPVQFQDTIDFEWTGSYFELYTKVLHVEVWIWHPFSPNEFLAKAEKSLYRIASGEMNMSGPEWQIKTTVRRKGRKEEVGLGALQFQCIFQEVLNYSIKFQNWVAHFSPWHMHKVLEEGDEDYLYPYAVFRMHSGMNPTRRERSRAKELRLKSGVDALKADLGEVPPLRFTGTRLGLEEGELYVDLYHDRFLIFKKDRIGSARISLSSVVENGFLSSKLRYYPPEGTLRRMGRVMTCTSAAAAQASAAAGRELQKVGQISGTVDVDADESFVWAELLRQPLTALQFKSRPARLHREFAQVGELDPPELRDYEPYNHSYLAVHVIAARDLVGADANGLSDPYVTVEWAGQRLRTKVVSETLNPLFDEVLYFQIRSFDEQVTSEELAENPSVRITLWDADPTGSSDLLGTTKLYLHWITGTRQDRTRGATTATQQRQIPVQRRKVKKWRRNQQGHIHETEITTRFFSDELKLSGLQPGIDSFVKVAAWFRAPGEGDLKDPAQTNGRDLLLLPDMKQREKESLLQCICDKKGTPWNRTPADPILNRVCVDIHSGQRCTRIRELVEKVKTYPRTIRLVKRLYKHFRLQDMMAINQYNEAHFLPTYLQPMSPPKVMVVDTEELPALAIRTSNKPNLLFMAAQLVRSIEFKNPDGSLFDGAVNINSSTWMSPDFFLSMKKGDVKAHCLLLANLFLGLSADAYVCIGWAERRSRETFAADTGKDGEEDGRAQRQAAGGARLVPHVWVMTRESDNHACMRRRVNLSTNRNDEEYNINSSNNNSNGAGGVAEVPELAGLRNVGMARDLLTRDAEEDNRDIIDPETQHLAREGGAVKFWEVTRGAYYAPLPNRWRGQDDDELLQSATSKPKPLAPKSKTQANQPTTRSNSEGEENDDLVHENVVALNEEDLAGAERDRQIAPVQELLDQYVPVDEVFELSYAEDDEGEPLRQLEKELDVGRSDRRQSSRRVRDVSTSLGTNLGDNDAEDDLDGSRGDGAEDARSTSTGGTARMRQNNPETPLEAYNGERKILVEKHRARAKLAQRHYEKFKTDPQLASIPYRRLACVFNHQNLWLNIQNTDDPRSMTFEMEEGTDCGWLPVLPAKPGSQHASVSPHYPPRPLGPRITEESVSKLQSSVMHEVCSGIENYRNTYNVPTRIAEASSRLPRKIREVLEAKHKLTTTDKIRKNGWVPDPNGNGKGWWKGGSKGALLAQDFERVLQTLISSCPPGYRPKINFVKLNTSDPKEVRRVVLRRRSAGTAGQKPPRQIFEEVHDGKESFAVGVKVIALPNAVCVVHVGIMVVYPDDRKAIRIA